MLRIDPRGSFYTDKDIDNLCCFPLVPGREGAISESESKAQRTWSAPLKQPESPGVDLGVVKGSERQLSSSSQAVI